MQGYFDLIVTNPPYIEASDEHLTQGDVRFEPSSALVSGDDGLQDIRHIIRDAPKYLFEQGCLMIEHGWNQGPAVRQLLLAAGFEEVLTRQDLNGHDRVSSGRLP